VEQRRVYGTELRRWLTNADPSLSSIEPDDRLRDIERYAPLVRAAFEHHDQRPPRAQMTRDAPLGALLIWMRPNQLDRHWSGIVVPPDRANVLFSSALAPLLEGQPFTAALRDDRAWLWGTPASDETYAIPVGSLQGWTMAFTDREFANRSPLRLALNYGRVIFPIVVLACGLLMTAWIVRRELALAELQSAFVAGVTHEFKSPLTSIRLLMERITSNRLAPGDSAERYYAAIERETNRLEGLVNRLLEAQKLQSGQKTYAFQPGELDGLVRDAVDRMRPQAEARHISIALQTTGDVPAVPIDAESVSDAVRNLLDNAIKYSPDRARVKVSLGVSNGSVELTVGDEGVGVDPADAQRIFEPFYRSRRGDRANVHGTGLGLAIVKATIEAHGGSVRVASDGRHGSLFTLAFPVERPTPGAPDAAS
jgi:signal transduction histidine kinase